MGRGPYKIPESSYTAIYMHSPQTVGAQIHAPQQRSQPHTDSSNLPKTTSFGYDTQSQKNVIQKKGSEEGNASRLKEQRG